MKMPCSAFGSAWGGVSAGSSFDSMSVADNIAYPLREHAMLDAASISHG
jgi:ABC-type transporter Mla maintaining outer membrane lipid asymmetry ATPase subunit MlaF